MEREAYFYENQGKFCVHSGAMDKKFSADSRENTPRPHKSKLGVRIKFPLTALNCSEIFPIFPAQFAL